MEAPERQKNDRNNNMGKVVSRRKRDPKQTFSRILPKSESCLDKKGNIESID